MLWRRFCRYFRKKDASKTGMRMAETDGLILLGISAMVGTGIFTVTGIRAATYALTLIVSIVFYPNDSICPILCRFTLSSANGGAYSYCTFVLEFQPSWLVG